jgi:hypothetical protein
VDFRTKIPFNCADDDSRDTTFIPATKFIGARDTVDEFLACGVYPLSASVGFNKVVVGVTPVTKFKMPMPEFLAARKDDEDDVKFLVGIELDAKGIVGSYTRSEHDTCITSLRNGGRLNRMFELMGVAYSPRLVPGSDAFTEASKKRKEDAAGKAPVKHPRASRKKKGECVKASTSRGKARLK